MGFLDKTPVWARHAARRILPARMIDAARDFAMRRFYRSISMVSRDSRAVTWFRRVVLRRKPVLFHFEVHITDHCNLNCKGCTHFSNLCPPTFADLGEFTRDMKAMRNLFSAIRQIYLLGGEPLLHPQVAEFVRVARDVFPETRISLMTNGTRVTRMGEEFWKALAESNVVLLCDSYPIGLPVDDINALGRQHGVEVEWTIEREEFFKMPIDPAGGHDANYSFRRCQGFNNCPIVRDGELFPCAFIAYADVFRERFGLPGLEVTGADRVDILSGPDPETVMKFLTRPVPWCSNCDAGSLEYYKWGRSQRKVDEWTKAS